MKYRLAGKVFTENVLPGVDKFGYGYIDYGDGEGEPLILTFKGDNLVCPCGELWEQWENHGNENNRLYQVLEDWIDARYLEGLQQLYGAGLNGFLYLDHWRDASGVPVAALVGDRVVAVNYDEFIALVESYGWRPVPVATFEHVSGDLPDFTGGGA